MSLVNIYLNETPLTSTKNRFLEKDSFINIFKESGLFKRTLKSELFSPKKCLTQNRFLLDDPFLKKDDVPEKKKKKKVKSHHHYVMRSKRSKSRSKEMFQIGSRIKTGYMKRSMPRKSDSLELSEDCIFESVNLDSEMIEDEPLTSLQCVSFGSANTNQILQEKSLGSFGEFTFGGVNTNPNFRAFSLRAAGAAPAFGAAPASVFSLQNFPESISEKIISKMPTYNLDAINLYEETEFEFSSFSYDLNSENYFANAKRKKIQLLNIISMALMFHSNLKDEADNYRIVLQKSIDDVRLIEPEFILKVALYARQELQIRVVSNFLLSYAAFHFETRIYLEKYFETSIVLPSDWIQVAEYFQVLSCGQNKRPFPAALRRVMRKSFHKFDKYQLAKYNKVKTKKKQKIEVVSASELAIMDNENITDDSDRNISSAIKKTFTLKELIRSLHINSPSEYVMCLLEKKYPKSQEEFMSSGLPGIWNPEKSGKRMKLPIPETWETRVSACGNKPEVWESLIDHQKLPYMAMLRNLKNLILSGISSSHHKKIIENLQNKKYVINSRQLPMQYFEAYKVLRNLQEMIENEDMSFKSISFEQMPIWKRLQFKKLKSKIQNTSASIVEEYKSSICKALEISSRNNLHPIPGKTLIVCEIDPNIFNSRAKFKNCETFIMMALMTLKACEDCKMCIFSRFKEMEAISLKGDHEFFDVLMKTCGEYEKLFTDGDYSDIDYVSELEVMLNLYLRSQSMQSLKLDHLIFLQMTESMEAVISSFLHKYRQLVNSELLYTNVSFSLRNTSFSEGCISDKDVYICGSSSSFVKFIAERSKGGQLFYVENIDVKYNLPEISESKTSFPVPSQTAMSPSTEISNSLTSMHLNYKTPKWRTIRIFISSTFKDMVSERDLLIRYVFPELKKRAATVFAKIVEVDLRWGITEADSSTKRAAEICLREAQKADIFVGIIGERYGSVYDFQPSDSTDFEWVKECPPGLSITELEIYAAALRNPQESRGRSFFYFRNNYFLSHVHKKWTGYFMAEDFESKAKVETLKQKIRSENFNILDGYPCHFAGICENKPVLAGLDVLGNRVLDDLWKAVQKIQKTEPYRDNLSEADMHQQNLIESKKFFIDQKNFSRDSVTKKIDLKCGIFVIYGTAGCGKTTFLINLLPCLKKFTLMKFFIGISPRSRDLSYIIQYLCKRTCQELGTSISLPPLPADIVSYFPDFLVEASNCCGGRDIIFLIDGLDRLEENDQRLDWLPLILPKKIKVICSASQSSLAFKVLCERENFGSIVSFFEMPPFLLPEREQIVRNYLSYYRKVLDESAFSNKMLKIVTKKDSSNPFYLQIVCDFLRIYGSFESLESMLQNIPSSIDLFFQEIILQMENEFGCILIQTILILLCITKEGLEDADLHSILSFANCLNDLKIVPPFNELKENITNLDPEKLLCQVKYCSLLFTISTFAYGQMRQESFSLVGTEFEKAARKFYRNRNLTAYSKSLHCVLAAYYHNVCDMTNDGTYKVRSGSAFRSLLYHMFHGGIYKELNDLLCSVTFLKAVFLANADSDLMVYYSSLLCDILPSDQKLSREIDCSHLSSFYSFVSRNFHIFHQSPDLLIQQAVNELSSLVDLKKYQKNCYLLENLSRRNKMDYRLVTLSGFSKNITASVGENLNEIVVLGTEDGYLKVLHLTARRVVRTMKAHASEITYICCVGRNRMCVSSVDGTLSIWNTEDFSRISVLYGHRHNVTCCCSDPAGFILYSSGWDNSVRLWSVKDGRSISIIEDFRCPVNWIDHHPQKQQIACGLWNGNIEIWDTISIQKKTVMPSLNGSVKSLAYIQDGVNIVSSYINSEITIWSSEEGLKMSCLKGHTLPVKTFTSLLNDSIVISGSEDSTLKVWSTVHQSIFTNITDAKICPVNLIEFMSENLLAVAFQNSEIWIFDINNGDAICKLDLGMDVASVFCKYSSANTNPERFENYWGERYIIFGTQSGKLMLGDVSDSSVSTVLELHSKITAAIHNCKIIVCGTSEGDIGMFYSSKKLLKIVQSAHRGFIGTFSLTEQNETLHLLSSGNDNVMKLWKIEWNDFELILQNEFLSRHRDAITCSLFHSPLSTPSSLSNLLTGSYDNNVMLWEKDSVRVFEGLQCSILKIACSGDYILGCGNDGALVMWHKNGAILTTIPGINQSSAILTFYVTGDDSGEFAVILAYVDLDGSIKINKPLQLSYYCSFDGHSKAITSCCATESNEIVSCSLDGCVNLWKVPIDMFDDHFTHESSVTGLLLSNSFDFAVSSDSNGNLVLWKIKLESSTSCLIYAGKKKYDQGFIKRLSWLKNQKIACVVESGEKNFLDIIQFNDSPHKTALCLQVTKSYTFESEVSCFDSCDQTDGIVVGFKSGHVMYINPETKHLHKISMDWILGLCFYERSQPSDRFFASYVDGRVKAFTVASFLSSKDSLPDPLKTYEPPDTYESSKFTSIMCYARESKLCCGDSDGILRIYAQNSLEFIEKVHDNLVSGICVIDSFLFTSSLDKTVKGWDLKSFKQICQFNSDTPVSCLSSVQKSTGESGQLSNILIIGTTSGNVHLLQFHSKSLFIKPFHQ